MVPPWKPFVESFSVTEPTRTNLGTAGTPSDGGFGSGNSPGERSFAFSQQSLNAPSLSASQAQVDGMVSSFVAQSTDWRSLAAMATGGLFYRFGRMGTLALASCAGRPRPFFRPPPTASVSK
ncbi:MAG: hypothetical protein U1F57_01485 [bacterium]